ncbi:TPA: hypothetical protein ACJIUP_003974 [Pseudomonas aeruginosa]
MSSTQHQLIEQCATRLRGIVEALDNIHDSTQHRSPHRWSTDLDDVHSSAESLLSLIKDQAPTQAAQGLAGAALAQPSPALPPFAEKVLAKLRRFYDCASDFESGGVDIGRRWLDLLTQLGLLNRVQRSPALWEISQQGEDLLGMPQPSPAQELAERGTQHRFSTTEQTCRHDFAGVWWNDNGETKTGKECRECGFFIADIAEAPELERPEVVGYRIMRAQADKIYQRVDKAAAEYEAGRSALGYMEDIAEAALCLRNRLDDLLAAAPGNSVPQAWLDVQAERRRQITAEGWTPQHDDEHADGQMSQAAGCYALHAGGIGTDWPDGRQNGSALFWPWDKDSWKPTTPRRDLVKACALALAEIERLDRAAATQGGPSDA